MNELTRRAIDGEMKYQDGLWGKTPKLAPKLDAEWLPILMEEVGECAKAMLHSDSYSLRAELIQVAAVATQWAEGIQFLEPLGREPCPECGGDGEKSYPPTGLLCGTCNGTGSVKSERTHLEPS